MSYNVDSVKYAKCPCGKGVVRRIIESNDWFQTRESVDILCESCKKNYELISEYFCPKPKHDYTIYYCKSKNNGEKIKLDL